MLLHLLSVETILYSYIKQKVDICQITDILDENLYFYTETRVWDYLASHPKSILDPIY